MIEVDIVVKLLVVAIDLHTAPQSNLEVVIVVRQTEFVVECQALADFQTTPEVCGLQACVIV